ncbi:MAG TPA: glycosyltransferase, partial [Candidatus Limnocylindria bacterium]|nr:glycosyltransferase [Candidatus Limnocylindria bacterium]
MALEARRRGQLPPPDSPRRLLLIRGVALLALAATASYLGWRALATLNLDAWYLAVPMLAFEVHAAVGLGLFTFSLWDVDRRPARRPLARIPSIAVVIPTYNEGPEILVPTIAAAAALEPAHETWVLDDGERPEIEELARSLGV